jgi:glycosyltransferase involved in cell wall biosynthesis
MITFIIPSIGRDTLGRTLRSLIHQTDPLWTCMVVMDGVDIPRDLPTDERIKFMKLDQKTGESNHGGRVRNVGMKASTDSTWFAFVDDDDTVTSDYVEKLKKSIHEMPDIDVFIFRMINKDGIFPPLKETYFKKYRVGISFAIQSSIFSNDGICFEPSDEEDYDFLNSVRKTGKNIHILPYICYIVRQDVPCERANHLS